MLVLRIEQPPSATKTVFKGSLNEKARWFETRFSYKLCHRTGASKRVAKQEAASMRGNTVRRGTRSAVDGGVEGVSHARVMALAPRCEGVWVLRVYMHAYIPPAARMSQPVGRPQPRHGRTPSHIRI